MFTYARLPQEFSKKFNPKRISCVSLAKTYRALSMEKRSKNVFYCGSDLVFNRYEDDSVSLTSANFCRDRLCPMCNWRKSLKLFQQIYSCVDVLKSDYAFVFVTLTVQNCSGVCLNDTLNLLNKSFVKMLRRKRFNFVKGAFCTREITYNVDTNQFHPHIHSILVVDKDYFSSIHYMTQADLCTNWQLALGVDYIPVCHIERVKGNSPDSDGLSNAVAEVAKYSVKDTDYTRHSDDINQYVVSILSSVLANKRMYQFYGVFKDIHKQLNLDDDVNKSDLVFVDDDAKKSKLKIAMILFFSFDFENCVYVNTDIDVIDEGLCSLLINNSDNYFNIGQRPPAPNEHIT